MEEKECKGDGSCGSCQTKAEVEVPEYKFDSMKDVPAWERYELIDEDDYEEHNKLIYNDVWTKQVGGSHYKDFEIQPTEFIMKNKLSFLQGCIIKRICRYNLKGMAREDLEKAKHEIDMIIELERL